MSRKRKPQEGGNSFSKNTGYFTPQNPHKYKGDLSKVHYKSKIEERFMRLLDTNPNVLNWNCEEVVVPYRGRNPIQAEVDKTNGQPVGYYEPDDVFCSHETFLSFKKKIEGDHDYHIDFWMRAKCWNPITKEDDILEFLIETKYEEDTQEPRLPLRGSRNRYWKKLETYYSNGYKWHAANEYAKKRGQIFLVLNEKQLNKSLDFRR